MEDEIKELELMFQNVDNDLQYIKHKLESEFSGSSEKGSQNNPVKLMKRIKRMQDDLAPLKNDMTTILTAKQSLAVTSNKIFQNAQTLAYLQARVAIEPVQVSSDQTYVDLEEITTQLTPNEYVG